MSFKATHMLRVAVFGLFLILRFAAPDASVSQDTGAIRVFDEGTRLLNSGDFAGAVNSFNEAEMMGYGSSALFHNRGIAHYRLDEIGSAIRYLEKALFLAKDDATILHSLDIVSSRLIDSYSELPIPVWTRFQRTVLNIIPVNGLLFVGLAIYLFFCVALLLNILGYWRSGWHRRLRLLSATLAVVFIFMALSSSIWPAYPREAVVLAEETSLLEQPDSDAAVAENIHEGLVVGVVSDGLEWSLVQLPNGARGWIMTEMLGAI